ncbi:UDP-N-acetylmuramoyl-L-alanyl-D-glutamate--2,6-diaminopimelate ligase [Candidatus Vampirococcus lugosii]|uniref:UDP-N-acetylmuramoylalanyl-D-glutamate--2, 6-diaminopimelate ligase n=1 Tax=Candidatus Vampirococcus lugosii TaxID=2789015 RepID=A0ABS5QKL3_9BACT|nr:UDP-N-acetylmuramoyl-L-alanyl-D-glutamate--2,6-diaminopimelate ligase [Candidatus Vampirococcus lugosii]MBS8121617.1 UDP-N-acetylmuramoylalanyl-D-glutamate--2,6-diaminopimelate ligase [Candidatus Vampirococcus lugosii]
MKDFLRKSIFYKIYKKSLANIATIINGKPSQGMFIVGVTGTDGKSTTCNLLHKIYNDNLGKTLLVTTISIKIGDEEIDNNSKMTSLNPFKLQKILAYAKEKGCKYAVLEVSSHGLDQYRFEGVEFDMGILTNITPEHLDYHGDFETYVETKKKLFDSILLNSKNEKLAVLPKDDRTGRIWYEDIGFDKSIDFSINTNAGIKANNIELNFDKTSFEVFYLGKTYPVSVSLLGKFNVYNILASFSAGLISGIKIEDIIVSLENFLPLSGRMEYLFHNNKNWFIDFAHTPNGLESVLTFLKEISDNTKIITVFGAPGNRDKFKRPQMGEKVDNLSDVVIITDDDPDTEDKYQIIDEISKGVNRKLGNDYYIIPNRANAIDLANEISNSGDIILLAGKGHEKIQVTNFGKVKWNDKEYVCGL